MTYQAVEMQKDFERCNAISDEAARKSCINVATTMNEALAKRISENMGGKGQACGPIDTPIGTLLGGLVGVGLGWAGLRRIMRL